MSNSRVPADQLHTPIPPSAAGVWMSTRRRQTMWVELQVRIVRAWLTAWCVRLCTHTCILCNTHSLPMAVCTMGSPVSGPADVPGATDGSSRSAALFKAAPWTTNRIHHTSLNTQLHPSCAGTSRPKRPSSDCFTTQCPSTHSPV